MAKSITKPELEQYIKDVMGITTITPMINKQINELVLSYNMTYLEIARCLVYADEQQHYKWNVMYGIKAVLNVRELSAQYFKQLELDQQKQSSEGKKIVEYQDNNIIFNIKSLKNQKRKTRQFDVSTINVEGENDGN